MLRSFHTRSICTFSALLFVGIAAAYGQSTESDSPGRPAFVPFDQIRKVEEIPVDPYRWDAGLDRFETFATPGLGEYGRARDLATNSVAPAIVPEPGSMVLLAGGLAMFAVRRFRRAA